MSARPVGRCRPNVREMRSPGQRDVLRDLCDVEGCPEHRRCVDADRPEACVLWRMQHDDSLRKSDCSNRPRPVVVDGEWWYPTASQAAKACGMSAGRVIECMDGDRASHRGHRFSDSPPKGWESFKLGPRSLEPGAARRKGAGR